MIAVDTNVLARYLLNDDLEQAKASARIARHHGGRFELLAREGGGLIARVSLPAQESAASPDK